MRARAGILIWVAFLAYAAPAEAQAPTLTVHVTGPDGPVADATVDLLYQDVLLMRGGTDDDGVVRLTGVARGTFEVRVEAIGHRTARIGDVDVSAGDQSLEVTLEHAPIAMDAITVRGARVQIDRENVEFSTSVAQDAIDLLPVTHEATDLVGLTPGARPGHVWGGANLQANSYRIDGLSANHPGMGGELLRPSVNWIEEVHVRGLGAGARYGGFQGGLIDVTTKRGTNRVQGALRTSFEHDLLSSTNLVETEIGREPVRRMDIEGEVRGPLIRDHLFYYVSGERVAMDSRALNHLRWLDGDHAPVEEERSETRTFGKLTWTPGSSHVLEISGAYTDIRADNYQLTGYEGPEATHRYVSPTWFINGSITRVLGEWGTLQGRVNHFSRDERFDPAHGRDVPGISTFSASPPFTAFGNAPLTLRSAPSSTSASLESRFRFQAGSLEHSLDVGAEYSRGTFLDRRLRNGGMTWRAENRNAFDPGEPSTWTLSTLDRVGTIWGGEVRLDADVSNAAAYAQGAFSLGPRIFISPGLRWSTWSGWLTPGSGDRFLAVEDDGLDPRVGISVDLTGSGDFVAKGHWGRYHQSLISQMFDRAAGSDTFTNEEYWWYHGDGLADPRRTFTEAEREAGVETGEWSKIGEEILNETGPVEDFRQPYVDQWLVGLEKQISYWGKVEALYTRRSNRDMVALVDRNRHSNYTRFEDVRVFGPDGRVAPYGGGSVLLPEVWVPNHAVRERLRCKANDTCPDETTPPVPGMEAADTLGLVWDPDYVLTTAPDARREFRQFQLNLEIALPEWGASLSFARTRLEGNLDNVSGYTDPEGFGAGPYVRVNEGVNAFGSLENYSDIEWKASFWGRLPLDLRGGLFYTYRSGDHYSPRFRLYGLGFFSYRVGTGALEQGGGTTYPGQELDWQLLAPLEGHHVFIGPRGQPTLLERANLDVRLERPFEFGGLELAASMDIFNVFASDAITSLNTMVNNGPDYGLPTRSSPLHPSLSPNLYFKAPQERVPPRSFRLGLSAYF